MRLKDYREKQKVMLRGDTIIFADGGGELHKKPSGEPEVGLNGLLLPRCDSHIRLK